MKKEKLAEALWFAVSAHAGQFDKAGFPYVLHPIRVSEAVESDNEKIVALLHDVVEDTDITLAQVYERFGGQIAQAVLAMTKQTKAGGSETYREYLDRIREEPMAVAVKLADMADNSRPERIAGLSVQKQVRLVAKYARGRHYLLTGEWYDSNNLDQVIKDGYRR